MEEGAKKAPPPAPSPPPPDFAAKGANNLPAPKPEEAPAGMYMNLINIGPAVRLI